VRQFSSNDRPEDVEADRYFAEEWTKPKPVLSATLGAHRWVWDLRRPRPKAVEYGYSIAAVWGIDTPYDPSGQLVEPGRYTAILRVDDQVLQANFEVLPDPRVVNADYAAARAFSESLYAPMEEAWRGYAETKGVRTALDARLKQIRDPRLLAEAQALRDRLEPPTAPNSGFGGESATLATLETSAEASDAAPTAALRATAAGSIARVAAEWAAWKEIEARDLTRLNARLKTSGLSPITVPPEEQLTVGEATGGEEVP
jgi:hypothetical protein